MTDRRPASASFFRYWLVNDFLHPRRSPVCTTLSPPDGEVMISRRSANLIGLLMARQIFQNSIILSPSALNYTTNQCSQFINCGHRFLIQTRIQNNITANIPRASYGRATVTFTVFPRTRDGRHTGLPTDTWRRTDYGLHTDLQRAIHGHTTDKLRSWFGRATDFTRAWNGRATVWVESWKLDFGLLEAAGGRNRHASVIPQSGLYGIIATSDFTAIRPSAGGAKMTLQEPVAGLKRLRRRTVPRPEFATSFSEKCCLGQCSCGSREKSAIIFM